MQGDSHARIELMGAFAHLSGARELIVKINGKKPVDKIPCEFIPRCDEFHENILGCKSVSPTTGG